ncbi:Zinc finger protein 26 [Armadillidium vulgare]|nr:Zinc finger protein 26 [Armadillidium vulgare]
MHFLEEGPGEEESFIDQYGQEQIKYLSIESNGSSVSSNLNLNGVFKCFRCSFTCTSINELAIHYKRYRENEPFTCFHCGYVGISKEDFMSHSRSHLESLFFRCSKCPFRSETRHEIWAHVQKHEKDSTTFKVEKMKCPFCEKFISKQNIKFHLTKCDTVYRNIMARKEQEKIKTVTSNENSPIVEVKKETGTPNPVYTCPHCFFIFSSKFKRSKHIYSVHIKDKEENKVITISGDEEADNEEEEEEEEINEYVSDEENEEQLAVDKVGPDMNPSVQLERIYLCPICHYVFTSASSLNEHVVTHSKVTECPICKLNCETNFQLKKHMDSHSKKSLKKSQYVCDVCEQSFPTLGKLKNHIKEDHEKGMKCPYCPRIMKSESALSFHIEAHSKMKAYYCPKCKFTAKNSSLLQFHMSKFHPTKKRYTCSICDKAYIYKYSLARHEQNCPGKDSALVSKGGKKGGPEIEIDISQKEKLSCSECKAIFKEATHLKKHLLVHFHKTPFRCMKCGLRCKTKHTLTAHMKLHNLKAGYQCKVCLQKFKHKHALNNHSIKHSEKRPYTCEVCGMTFKRKANYRRHYDIHSDVKPFKCPLCDFTSRRKDGLYKHLETHGKDK